MPPGKVPRWVRRPEERPQELLDAALQVFSTHGYRATRLEQVAEAAGVTKGAIYYYFDNKEELLRQALESRIGAVFSGIEAEGRRAGGSAAERLEAVLRSAWARWCRPETARMNRLIMGELRTEFPEAFDAALRAGPMHVWRLVGDLLKEGQRSGEFAAHFDPHAAARFLVSGLMHQALLLSDLRERELDRTPPEQVFEAALGVLFRGILASAAKPSVRRTPTKRRPR